MTRDTLDPDDTLAEFRATRHTIAEAITAYNRDEHRIERASEAADHHDRLEELYRDTSDLMAALDTHLPTGGPLPAAWTPTTPAPRIGAPHTTTETSTATHESRQPAMTEHRNHDLHDYDLDPAHLDKVAVSELRDARDQAAHVGDLVCALRADNALEDRDALGPDGRRRTCRTCRDWADHLHDQLTGEIMRAGRWATDFTGQDVVTATTIATQVFALASVAPPSQWQELPEGEYRITVELNTTAYDVIVPGDEHGWDGQPRPPYIDSFRPGPAGCLILPVIHATARATAALTEARRYLTARSHR
ncbi:hypothetical protein [Nocardia nova]|uniref:Uncharacterized protein n=1 Tax=Nocardia nova TaxID=37330 RepID=A0A2S6A212_9NOCA|nr:hypothetical protein [Nocardia nova]PPJ25610.1 hypothetical protein C5F51_22550 [Nocardia nova]